MPAPKSFDEVFDKTCINCKWCNWKATHGCNCPHCEIGKWQCVKHTITLTDYQKSNYRCDDFEIPREVEGE